MQCPICKHNNRTNSKFCVKCGSKLPEEKYNQTQSDVSKKLAYVVTDSDIVDEDVLAETVDNAINEIIPYTSSKVMNKRCFKYQITGKITINEYISKVVNRKEFLTLFLNLIKSLIQVEDFGIQFKNIFLDINQIYIESNTLRVYLVCIPISNRNQDSSIDELLKEIILKSEFDYNENCKYVKELLAFFNDESSIDIRVIQNYISNMLSDEADEPIVNTNIAPERKQQDLEEENSFTTLLYEDDGEATTILSQPEEEKYYPHLIRKKNNEDILLDKPIFRIGKDRNNADYFIADNTAISRRHAEIISKNGEYYIIDKNSTNHVYIDDEKIDPNTEIKIVDKNTIRLGNEEFEFQEAQ